MSWMPLVTRNSLLPEADYTTFDQWYCSERLPSYCTELGLPVTSIGLLVENWENKYWLNWIEIGLGEPSWATPIPIIFIQDISNNVILKYAFVIVLSRAE